VLGAAFEGDQYAELDSDWGGPTSGQTGEPASISIYQDIPTEPGATYEITFAWAARPNTTSPENRIRVEWDGVIVYDTGNVADPNAGISWIPVGPISVTATGATTRLRFTDMGIANSVGTFLDDIEVVKTSCGPGETNEAVASSPAPTTATSFFTEGFGTGTTDTTIGNSWSEGGNAGDDATKRNAAGGGDDSASSNGGRFAAMLGTTGWICRTVNASTRHTMNLAYLWRGDSEAEASDSGIVEYKTGGACSDGAGWSTFESHVLTTTSWTSESGPLPASLNGKSFLLRFRNASSAGNEDFRVDGIVLSGIPTI
jgi:hypothetical protein